MIKTSRNISLFQIVKLLHKNGATVNVFSTNHRTPLHVAAYYGHKDLGNEHDMDDGLGKNGLVEYLIQTDVDVNYRDDWNETALNDAKKRGHWAIVDMLAMYTLNG